MTVSADTNVLLPALETSNPLHSRGAAFLASLNSRDDVVFSEFMLAELYVLLRNPAVVPKPLSAGDAAEACQAFRNHVRWQIAGVPGESRAFHDRLWHRLAEADFPRRRIYDWRVALSLIEQGVDEFATANLQDFVEFGFTRLWNPLADPMTS